MASGDATAIPIKNQAYRVTFPILDADGDLVTAAAALDSEVSKDGGTFADLTAEATEIATASGMYFLDLTATEMNADTVAIIVKTTTTGAKTTPIVLYPAETGDITVNATAMSAGVVDQIIDDVVEGSLTLRQIVRIMLAALAGKTTGGGLNFRNNADTVNRIVATVDASNNRTAITLDGT